MWKALDGVLVVSDGCSYLPLEVLGIDWNEVDVNISTDVAEASVVGPVRTETSHVVVLLEGEQIVCLGNVEVDACLNAVVGEGALQTCREATGGFPLYLRVLDVDELECSGLLEEFSRLVVGAGC